MTQLLQTLANRLAPLFLTPNGTQGAALDAAIQAINACNPTSPLDYVRAARILALSLAAITALGHAEAADLSAAQRQHYLAKANTLSRSAAQSEAAWAKDHKPPAQAKKVPAQADQAPSPPAKAAAARPALPDAAFSALLGQATIGEGRFTAVRQPETARASQGFRQRLLAGAPLRILA